jgi:hypothetical protein
VIKGKGGKYHLDFVLKIAEKIHNAALYGVTVLFKERRKAGRELCLLDPT